MARKTVREQKDGESAELKDTVMSDVKDAGVAIDDANAVEADANAEDGIYAWNGTQIMTADDKPYTLTMLNDLEERAKRQKVHNNAGGATTEDLTKHAEKLTEDVHRLYSDRDMWKQRAQDAETRLGNIEAKQHTDSMGIKKVVE